MGSLAVTVFQLMPRVPRGRAGAALELDLEPGEGGFVDFTPPAPGMYTIIDHRLAVAARGATGTIVADP